MIRRLLIGTLLSILVFFTVSFLTVLIQIAGPLNGHAPRVGLDVGWPLTFYTEFWVRGSTSANYGWNVPNLMLVCLITWIIFTGSYIALTRATGRSTDNVRRN